MRTITLKITALSLFVAALMVAPAVVRAQDATNAPSMSDAPVKHKKHDTVPFHGKLAAVDKNAMTLKVGERTFEITSETKISKTNGPATLADGMVGEIVSGAYKTSKDGKLIATTVHFGPKPESGQAETVKKKKKVTTGSATNAVPNGASVPN